MAGDNGWAPQGPARFGLAPGGPVTKATTELHAVASPAEGAAADVQAWKPTNPLFWFGAAAALTVGLMAFSTTVRVGKAQATFAVGSSK